jgi:pimeloyl-ACP methyl ester carboxylesterase
VCQAGYLLAEGSRCADAGLYRGMGESTYATPERSDKMSLESLTRDAIALIEHVGWKDVDILGFSMGGNVSARPYIRDI